MNISGTRIDVACVTLVRLFVAPLRRGGAMRAHLLTTAAALLAAMPAHALDATWSMAPVNSDFNTAANWTPATVPTGTAFFGTSTITGLTFNSGSVTSLGGFTFNPGAPAYSDRKSVV